MNQLDEKNPNIVAMFIVLMFSARMITRENPESMIFVGKELTRLT